MSWKSVSTLSSGYISLGSPLRSSMRHGSALNELQSYCTLLQQWIGDFSRSSVVGVQRRGIRLGRTRDHCSSRSAG